MTRLLNINSYHYRRGGSDVVYLEHGAMFEALGFECGWFAMKHPKNLPTPWQRHFIDELEFDHDYSAGRKLVMAAKVVWSWEARSRLARLLDEFPADIAHLHCIYHHHSPAILPLLSARGVPAVMTAHDLKIACPAYKMLNSGGVCERCREGSVLNVLRHRCVRDSAAASAVVALESGVHRLLDTWRRHLRVVVCPSRFFLEKFVEWGWQREQLLHVPNWVAAAAFEPEPRPGTAALYFGRLAPEKGLQTLICAAHAAGMPLQLAGTGPEEPVLRALVAALGADVRFLGFVAGAALHDTVRAARCVVMPSEWYENAPMMVLEAMALGKPVIGARIGGIPEVVVEGETGWLYTSGSVDELAQRLAAVRTLPEALLQRMGSAARAQVEQRFSRTQYLEHMLALYARLGVRLPAAAAAQPVPVWA
jgi:glycosyltransferase involved in cell wall biosynthesis